ncbi:MerR family transcriptional regulator [Streptomyces sp. NPDC057702]|uniref:MerR family transcriptional regulator n=1 Tax=unclassified Streptomyces TaxID=2593676 RepID=UPI00369ADF2B
MNQASGHGREYRVAELGRAAGVKVRNLRYYQGRGLLPPPRYEGRVALYSEAHLARLRLISDLLARGYAVNGIAELFAAWDRGSCLAEFLGFEEERPTDPERPAPPERPARPAREGLGPAPEATCRAELRERFGDQATEENLRRAAELGYLSIDGETITHASRELMEAAAELVRGGVPLDALLTAGAMVRAHTAELAHHLVTAVRAHTPDGAPALDGRAVDPAPTGTGPTPPEAHRVAHAVATLRPLAGEALGAEFARAVEHAVATEYGTPPPPANAPAPPAEP